MSKDYIISNDSIFSVENGTYMIEISIGDGDFYKSFSFMKVLEARDDFSFRIELPRIMKKYSSELHSQQDLGFYYCEEISDGLKQDYFSNGKLRMKGEFRNGIPIKTIEKYNRDGELIETEYYNNKGKYKKSKYPDYEKYLKSY